MRALGYSCAFRNKRAGAKPGARADPPARPLSERARSARAVRFSSSRARTPDGVRACLAARSRRVSCLPLSLRRLRCRPIQPVAKHRHRILPFQKTTPNRCAICRSRVSLPDDAGGCADPVDLKVDRIRVDSDSDVRRANSKQTVSESNRRRALCSGCAIGSSST